MTEFPQLAHLGQAYLHHDHGLEMPAAARAIGNYIAREPPDVISELIAEIKTILDSGMTESQISSLWITTWHASYEPDADGLSYRDWLTSTLNALQADPRARRIEAGRLVAVGHRQDLRCPENQDGDLDRPEPQLAAALAAEAQAEIGPHHELAGRQLTAVVKCGGCNEVIFAIDDGTFAQVHLTWARHPEPEPQPATRRLGSFAALAAAISNHQH
jgi:hypothetical protein